MASSPQPVSPEPTPALLAIRHLAKLASAAAPADQMVAALEEILVRWAAEDLDPDDLRDRVETLQSDLDAGAQAAEDYAAEAESEQGRALARAQLHGLSAARDRLAAVIGA